MNIFLVSFLNIVLIATSTRSVLSGAIAGLNYFSARLESPPRHDFPYAAIHRDTENPAGFVVMAKKDPNLTSKAIITFDSSNTVVSYLSLTTMKTLSKVRLHRDVSKKFLVCGYSFKGSHEASNFFNGYLKRDGTYVLSEYKFSKIYLDKAEPSCLVGNGSSIVRAEITDVIFTYSVKSDNGKVLAIFATGNYSMEQMDDDRQLKIIARATVGSYEEKKTYVITFQWASEKTQFEKILQSDDAYLRGDSPDFQKLGALTSAINKGASSSNVASSSSSRNTLSYDDDDDADDDASLSGIQMTKISSGAR